MVAFDVAFLKPAFAGLASYFAVEHQIVPAAHFSDIRRNPIEYHNKVVIGRLLSITNPDNGGYYGRGVTVAAQGSQKKAKILAPQQASSIMLVFGDYYNPPNCFCIFLKRKTSFQALFGDDISRSEMVRVGDFFAVKDPNSSSERLGESIIILRDPVVLSALIERGWPRHQLCTSADANWQVFFDEGGKTIHVMGSSLVVKDDVNQCNGYTCDRQAHCRGCFGKAPTSKPIVMICAVQVDDTPKYAYAYFPRFSSLKFTGLFFEDLEGLSARHISVIRTIYGTIQVSVTEMVEHVNQHGGWTVCGWHRQGIQKDDGTGEDVLSSSTVGHITMLEPTDPAVLGTVEFRNMLIRTPGDVSVPQLPVPAVQIPAIDAVAAAAAAERVVAAAAVAAAAAAVVPPLPVPPPAQANDAPPEQPPAHPRGGRARNAGRP